MTTFDLHTHHDRCGHARGIIRDYIEAAIDRGWISLEYPIIHLIFLVKKINPTRISPWQKANLLSM